ncbi:hypothetical protein ACLB1Q_34750 [Escherichia coli]
MVVNENPIRLVYRIPKSNYRAYSEGGLQFINQYSAPKEIAVDSTYAYVEMTLPYGSINGIWLYGELWPVGRVFIRHTASF